MEKRERTLLVVKYGAYTCCIVLLFALFISTLGKGFGLFQNILFIILGAEIYLCCVEYKRKTEKPLFYKEAFALGWQVSFFSGFLISLLIVLLLNLIDQGELLKNINGYKGLFMSQGKLSESEVDEALKMIVNPLFLLFTINLFYLIIGFFLSILIAFFVRTPTTTYSNEE